MTKRDLAEVGLKIIGINFLIRVITTIAYAIPNYVSALHYAAMMEEFGDGPLTTPLYAFGDCITTVPFLLLAYFFAIKTDRILALLRLSPEQDDTTTSPPNAFLPLGIKLTGLYLFIRYTATLLGYLPKLLSDIGDMSVTRSVLWAHWSFWGSVVAIPLALLLMLKTQKVIDIMGGAKHKRTAQ